MEFLFGTMRIENENKHIMRIKYQKEEQLPDYKPGFYYTHSEVYPDVILTDNFKIEQQFYSSKDSEDNYYIWYVLNEYNRNIDRSINALNQANEATSIAATAQEINSITFVTLAEAGNIDNVTAGEHINLFLEWSGNGIQYEKGQLRRYNDKLYKCISSHQSQETWNPEDAPSLWAKTADPAEEWPEWSQPLGAHDAYNYGAKVTYKDKHYINELDSNPYPPDTLNGGWREVNDSE